MENYRKLKDAGIGTYILFQETYHKESYETLHPTGPKHNYAYHTEAMDRAMEGGIDDVGLGVLFGLELYRYEFAGQYADFSYDTDSTHSRLRNSWKDTEGQTERFCFRRILS